MKITVSSVTPRHIVFDIALNPRHDLPFTHEDWKGIHRAMSAAVTSAIAEASIRMQRELIAGTIVSETPRGLLS